MKLHEFIDEAQNLYETFGKGQDNRVEFSVKRRRSINRKFAKDIVKLRDLWINIHNNESGYADTINWFMAHNSAIYVKDARGWPPDIVGAVLSQLSIAIIDVIEDNVPVRKDSNDIWRESMVGLVLFCHHELKIALNANFGGDFYPNEDHLEVNIKVEEKFERFPIPRHASQWFLFDCMRVIDASAADTSILQSLLQSDWMPDGPKIEEIDGTEAYVEWRLRRAGRKVGTQK